MLSEPKNVVSDSDTGGKTAAKTAKKEAKGKTAKLQKVNKEPVVYLGPNIKGIANYLDIFSDGCDSLFGKKLKEIPLLKELCVPVTKAGDKMAELKRGGAFCKLYEAVKEQLEKGEANE